MTTVTMTAGALATEGADGGGTLCEVKAAAGGSNRGATSGLKRFSVSTIAYLVAIISIDHKRHWDWVNVDTTPSPDCSSANC
jgi:hypothetical protein